MESLSRSTLSRRGFISGAGAAGIAGAATAYGLGTVGAAKAVEAGAADGEGEWTYEADLVIVGSGSSAYCAAIEAAEAGSSVLILEKSGIVGGNSKLCGGAMMGTGFQGQLELTGYEGDSPEKFANQMVRWAQGFGNEEIIREACLRSGEAIDWMIGLGRRFDTVDLVPPIWTFDEGYEDEALAPRVIFSNGVDGTDSDTGLNGTGNAHFTILENKLAEFENVAVKTACRVTHVLRDGEGQVIGVTFESNGETLRAKAHKAVLLACASIDNNAEMAAQFGLNQQLWGVKMREIGMDDPFCHDMSSNTGDGMQMAMELGAALQISQACCMPDLHYFGGVSEYATGMVSGSNPYKSWRNEGTILVNPLGRRFVAEDACWGYVVTEVAKQLFACGWNPSDPAGVNAYAICDADHYFQWQLQGQSTLEADGGSVICCDTVEELAERIGVPAENLADELDRWNSFCETGVDTQFGRRVDFGTIKTAPFYADAEKPKVLGSFAGVKVNLNAEVISAVTGEPIPRLYAAGTVAGGNYVGPFYFGCGWSILNTVVWGREAGQQAAALEAWDGSDAVVLPEADDTADVDVSTVADGTYTGTGAGMGGDINVTIEVADGVLTVTDISPNNETQGIGGYEAIEDGTYAAQIESAQGSQIDGVSGATITSDAIRSAVRAALEQGASR